MLAAWQRVAPFVLTGVLLFNLLDAVVNGGRWSWLLVGLTALTLALSLWWRDRAAT